MPEGSPAFCLESLFQDFDGRPVSWGRFLCRADQFRLTTHIGVRRPEPTGRSRARNVRDMDAISAAVADSGREDGPRAWSRRPSPPGRTRSTSSTRSQAGLRTVGERYERKDIYLVGPDHGRRDLPRA